MKNCEQVFRKFEARKAFNPCNISISLIEDFIEAALRAGSGELNFQSSICSGFELFRKDANRSQKIWVLPKSISRGALAGSPNGMGICLGRN
jgi:hypothetical protein